MLTGKQKRFLRSKAHHLDPIFQVGKGGVNENMIKQIAEALYISIFTVRKHIANIYEKLHVNSSSQVISLAYKNKLNK